MWCRTGPCSRSWCSSKDKTHGLTTVGGAATGTDCSRPAVRLAPSGQVSSVFQPTGSSGEGGGGGRRGRFSRNSFSVFTAEGRPAALEWAGTCTLRRFSSSIFSADHGAAHPFQWHRKFWQIAHSKKGEQGRRCCVHETSTEQRRQKSQTDQSVTVLIQERRGGGRGKKENKKRPTTTTIA